MNNGYDLELREEKVMRRKNYRRVKEDEVLGWRACKIAAAKPSVSLNKNTTTGATFIFTLSSLLYAKPKGRSPICRLP